MTINDISITEEEKKTIEDFLVNKETIKRLEKMNKKLTESVKGIFEKYNIDDPIDFNGSTLTVTESVRKTVDKKKKDQFIQALINMNKNYLVFTTVDIDTDTIYSEVQNGLLTEDFVKEYMSITPVKTLTVK